jgi:hypothetical protein
VGSIVPNGISLDNPSGSNSGVEELLKGIGGVGVGEGAGDGDGVIVIFSFPVGTKLAMSEAKTLCIPISSTSIIDNIMKHMFISLLTRLT